MASRELNIVIRAKNLASGALRSVNKDLGTLQSTAKKAAVNTARNVGIAAVGGSIIVATQVRQGLESLAELERVEALTAAALKSTGSAAAGSAKDIRKRSEALEDLTTIDDKAIQNAQNLLLTFTQISDRAFEPTLQAALDLNAAMGGDEDSLQRVLIQVGKAVNDPIKGLTALRRVGVSFTDEQEKRIKGLVEPNKLFEAQQIILAELSKEFGGAAAASADTYGGKMRKMQDAIEDAQMALATAFLPVLEKVSGKIGTLLSDPQVMRNIEGFGQTLADAFDDAIAIVERIPWDAVASTFGLMGQGAKIVLDMFTKLPPWVQTAVLTGWGLNKITGGALGDLAKMAFGGLRGSTPATPMFTKEVGLGGGGGAPIAGGGGRVGGTLARVGAVIIPAAAWAAAFAEFDNTVKNVVGPAAAFEQKVVDNRMRGATVAELRDLKADLHNQITNEMGNPLDGILKWAFVNPKLEEQERAVEAQIAELNAQSSRFASSAAQAWSKQQQTAYANLNATRNVKESSDRIAQRVAEARERIGSGFRAMGGDLNTANARLGVIAKKDLSVRVNSTFSPTLQSFITVDSVTRAITTSNTSSGFLPTIWVD